MIYILIIITLLLVWIGYELVCIKRSLTNTFPISPINKIIGQKAKVLDLEDPLDSVEL